VHRFALVLSVPSTSYLRLIFVERVIITH
jgi:hypothetical protein